MMSADKESLFMERNHVVLVDQEDQEIGEMEKLQAHQQGKLHRAFSVFIFNEIGEMLIHQRAANKYHGAGLWTNACCSHPQKGEDLKAAAQERLAFEMGMACDINPLFSFIYHAAVENNLIEHEFDHVFVGHSSVTPKPNPEEVQQYRWVPVAELEAEIERAPENFTYWFKSACSEVLLALKKQKR